MRTRVDVAEYWAQADPLESVRSCDERVGRNEDLPAQAERPGSDLQANGSIGDGEAVADSQQPGDPLLKLLYQRAGVGEPAPVQSLRNPLEEAIPVRDCGPANVKWFGKQRGSAENGEILYAGLELVRVWAGSRLLHRIE